MFFIKTKSSRDEISPRKKYDAAKKLSTIVDKSSFPETPGPYRPHPQNYKQERGAQRENFFHRSNFFVDKIKLKIYVLLLAHLRQGNLFLGSATVSIVFR